MAAPAPVRLFLVAAPGTEQLLAQEARSRLPDAKVVALSGGIELVGAPSLIARSNLLLRLPSRVLLRLGEVTARDFSRLRKGAAGLPLATFLPAGARVVLRAAAARSRLYHTGAIAENVGLALHDLLGATVVPGSPSPAASPAADDDEDDGAFLLLVRGERDCFTFSLDTSGQLLHRRGWRRTGGQAPMRETLAAALLALAEHAQDEPLCDPMCGSGTIAVEAALAAIGRAPGLGRRFAFERYVGHDAPAWQALIAAARAEERPRPLSIVAADADEVQLDIARKNAEQAGVAELMRFSHTPLAALKAQAERGLLVTNPPYGRRVGAQGSSLGGLYATLGRVLQGSFRAWRAAVLLEDRARISALGLDVRSAVPLQNGGLRVWVARRGLAPARAS